MVTPRPTRHYDTVLDITWQANANTARNNTFGVSSYVVGEGGITAFGDADWRTANDWITAMNADGDTGYLGYDDWRLPKMIDIGGDGCNFSLAGGTDCGYNPATGNASTIIYSEMASLFYDALGNLAYYDTEGNPAQPGFGLSNTGPFSNMRASDYWSGLEYALDTQFAWNFLYNNGAQGRTNKDFNLLVWAVRDGDVSAVPIPAAAWLFGSGLLGLVGMARMKPNQQLRTTS